MKKVTILFFLLLFSLSTYAISIPGSDINFDYDESFNGGFQSTADSLDFVDDSFGDFGDDLFGDLRSQMDDFFAINDPFNFLVIQRGRFIECTEGSCEIYPLGNGTIIVCDSGDGDCKTIYTLGNPVSYLNPSLLCIGDVPADCDSSYTVPPISIERELEIITEGLLEFGAQYFREQACKRFNRFCDTDSP